MNKLNAFIIYSSKPQILTTTIEEAQKKLSPVNGIPTIKTWRQMDIAGSFINSTIFSELKNKQCVIADISVLNFNVGYEIGYVLGKNIKIIPIQNKAIKEGEDEIKELGIFDTLGIEYYENSDDLVKIIQEINNLKPIDFGFVDLDIKAPVFLLEAKYKIEFIHKMISRVKKSGLFYRSFDPIENPRMSASLIVPQVAKSFGVIVSLLPSNIDGARLHNLRAAFISGLAHGMDKELMILQLGDEPVPIDYRDFVTYIPDLSTINNAISSFATKVTEALQKRKEPQIREPKTFLECLNLGASAAENEFRDLSEYYLEIDAFKRVIRGEVRVVLGRKGSGKTALFSQARDKFRRDKKNVVLDLKPEGYKLLKFKEDVLSLLQEGTLEHTLTAFWEYILLLEICYKLLEKDQKYHIYNHNLTEPYNKLKDLYLNDEFIAEGDFSERMTKILDSISEKFKEQYGDEEGLRLSDYQITEFLYKHDIKILKKEIENYLIYKGDLWFFIDNLDKGWPTNGINKEDMIIIRTLLEATRKLERSFSNKNTQCKTVIFLRNDVYELLIEETPDRGKEASVLLDWEDADSLREMLRRRFIYNNVEEKADFYSIWMDIADGIVDGEESSQYLIDRCLMRPRALLDCLNICKGYAINRGHEKITQDDILDGIKVFSRGLIQEISLEIRDVCPTINDVLYMFMGSKAKFEEDDLLLLFMEEKIPEDAWNHLIDILLWYGILGYVRQNEETKYIYSVSYNLKILKKTPKTWGQTKPIFIINPAFVSGLEISN